MIVLYSVYKGRKLFRAKEPEIQIIVKEAHVYQMHIPCSKFSVLLPIKSS